MTPDLFETLTAEDWISDPIKSLETWEKARARSLGRELPRNTLVQYSSMLRKAVNWMEAQSPKLDLATVTEQDLARYISTISAKPSSDDYEHPEKAAKSAAASAATLDRHRKRLQAVFSAFCAVHGREDNPASSLIGKATFNEGLYSRSDPSILTPMQWDAYIEWTRQQHAEQWFEIRNQALRITFMATGVSVSEARAIRLQDVNIEERTITIIGHGKVPTHKAIISDWAVADVAAWLAARRQLETKDPTDILFVGRTKGRSSERADASAMSESEIYQVIEEPFRYLPMGTALTDQRTGPQTLRNSYIARQLHLKIDPKKLTLSLGLHTTFTLDQIRKQVKASWGLANP